MWVFHGYDKWDSVGRIIEVWGLWCFVRRNKKNSLATIWWNKTNKLNGSFKRLMPFQLETIDHKKVVGSAEIRFLDLVEEFSTEWVLWDDKCLLCARNETGKARITKCSLSNVATHAYFFYFFKILFISISSR